MLGDQIAVAAFVVIVPAMLIFLITMRWWPRVSAVASGVMGTCLGVICLWSALSAVSKGVFTGHFASKLLRSDLYLEEYPVTFWAFFALFAIPGALLVLFNVWRGANAVRRLLQKRKGRPKAPFRGADT